MRNHENSLAYAKAQFVLSMTIFGTIGIVVRYIPSPSGMIALARGFIGMLFLLGIALLTKRKVTMVAIRKNIMLLIPSGIFLGMNWIFLFEAYRHTTVATATLCYYLAPMFVIMASPFVLKESISKCKAICSVIALTGMAFVSGIFQSDGMDGIQLVGILFGVGAATLYAGVILLNKKMSVMPSSDIIRIPKTQGINRAVPFCP